MVVCPNATLENVRDMLNNLELLKKNILRRVVVYVLKLSVQAECAIDEIFTAIETRATQPRLELCYMMSPVVGSIPFKLKSATQKMNALVQRHRGAAILIGPLYPELVKPPPIGVDSMQYSEDTIYWFMRLIGQHFMKATAIAASK